MVQDSKASAVLLLSISKEQNYKAGLTTLSIGPAQSSSDRPP